MIQNLKRALAPAPHPPPPCKSNKVQNVLVIPPPFKISKFSQPPPPPPPTLLQKSFHDPPPPQNTPPPPPHTHTGFKNDLSLKALGMIFKHRIKESYLELYSYVDKTYSPVPNCRGRINILKYMLQYI